MGRGTERVRFEVRIVTVPPSGGMASRELTTRFMTVLEIWPSSARTDQRSGACSTLSVMRSPTSRRSKSESSVSISDSANTLGCKVCWREKARSWRTNPAARTEFCRTSLISAKEGSPAGWRIRSRSQLPMMACRRLLKSWATPPANWPIACIFCAWLNWDSNAFCSEVSTM
jgi:hypothetical protein